MLLQGRTCQTASPAQCIGECQRSASLAGGESWGATASFGTVQVTLAQGSGARRLAEVRCRAAIQLLLVQASGEIYAAHSQRLPQAGAILMLDALAEMAQHARDVDADLDMRRLLAAAQAESKVSLLPQHDAVVPYCGFLAASVRTAVQDSCRGSMTVVRLEEQGGRVGLWGQETDLRA